MKSFFAMENRRLRRVLGGRARARGSGGKALKVTVVFLVILFILTQLAFMSSTSDDKDATDVIHSPWVLAILIIATTVVCGVTVYSCYQTPEHVTGKLALAVLYLAMMWYLWVFDYEAKRPSLFSDLTSGETTVIGWFLTLEFIIFVAYVITHWFYPYIVSKLELWPTGAKLWFRFRQVDSPHKDSVKFSYRPSGVFGRRYTFTYSGTVDRDGYPHGYGVWSDDSYHGECLFGRWRHGLPVGPFTSRERGSGATFSSQHIAYCTSRMEGLDQKYCIPIRSHQGLRYGVCGVEASTGGGFFEHLPTTGEHILFESLSGAIAEVRASKAPAKIMASDDDQLSVDDDDVSSTAHRQYAAQAQDEMNLDLDFTIVNDDELEVLTQDPRVTNGDSETCAKGFIEYHALGNRIYLRKEDYLKIPAQLTEDRGEALIFMHGYNCSTEFAMCKLGQLLALGRVPGNILPIVFSQSTGQALMYFQAKDAVPLFGGDCARLIRRLGECGVTRIHILTHSMGARLWFSAFHDLIRDGYLDETFRRSSSPVIPLEPLIDAPRPLDMEKSDEDLAGVEGGERRLINVRNVCLMNPDYDLEEFKTRDVPLLEKYVARTTVYADRNDGALFWAENFNRAKALGRHTDDVRMPAPPCGETSRLISEDPGGSCQPSASITAATSRLGRKRGPLCERIDVIDCTDMDQNVHSLRHSYFNLNMQIVGDITDIIRSELPARLRSRSLSDLLVPSDVLPSSTPCPHPLAPNLAIFLDLASIGRVFDRQQMAMDELKRRVWKFLGYRRPRRLTVAQRVETGLTILGGMLPGDDRLVMLHRVAGSDGEGQSEIATIDCRKTPLHIKPFYTKTDVDLEDITTDAEGRVFFLSKNHIFRLDPEGQQGAPVELSTNIEEAVPSHQLDYIQYYGGYLYLYEHVEQQLLRVPEGGGDCEKVFDFDKEWNISSFDVRERHGRVEILSCSNDGDTSIQWRREGEETPRSIDVPLASRCRFLDHPTADLAVVGCCRSCFVRIVDLAANTELCSIELPEARSVCSVLVNDTASQIYVTEWRVNHTYLTQLFIHYYDGDSEDEHEGNQEELLPVED
ncbi:hypothetical protein FOZ63_033166 [Perkinsus olseni]|uniref:Uncharacterized protein n=1 Tax=Perkinsus olseni TaxID=32597 RepID=A0A7J6RJW0_PEROL|nr:hypothetical protein FOZ63_033166 [Perkinsus olseni]